VPEETLVTVQISQQPQGGLDQTLVRASFVAQLHYEEGTINVGDAEPDSVQISCEWWWQDGNELNDTFVKLDTFMVSEVDIHEFSSIVVAAPGHVLIDHFWMEISWEDDDGEHLVSTDKVLFVHS